MGTRHNVGFWPRTHHGPRLPIRLVRRRSLAERLAGPLDLLARSVESSRTSPQAYAELAGALAQLYAEGQRSERLETLHPARLALDALPAAIAALEVYVPLQTRYLTALPRDRWLAERELMAARREARRRLEAVRGHVECWLTAEGSDR